MFHLLLLFLADSLEAKTSHLSLRSAAQFNLLKRQFVHSSISILNINYNTSRHSGKETVFIFVDMLKSLGFSPVICVRPNMSIKKMCPIP